MALKLALVFAKLALIFCQDFDRLALIFAKLALMFLDNFSKSRPRFAISMLISQGAFAFVGRYFDRFCVVAKNLALIFAELSLIVCQDVDRLALKLALIFTKLALICCQDFDRLALKLALIFAKLALIFGCVLIAWRLTWRLLLYNLCGVVAMARTKTNSL